MPSCGTGREVRRRNARHGGDGIVESCDVVCGCIQPWMMHIRFRVHQGERNLQTSTQKVGEFFCVSDCISRG